MSDPTDVAAIVAGMRIGRHIAEAAALDPYRAYEMTPGPDCASEAHFEAYARSTGHTPYHIVATAQMRPAHDGRAVVDARLRGHAVPGRRVVDPQPQIKLAPRQ